jgi:hypothetical protein
VSDEKKSERDLNTQLPSGHELSGILAVEAQREVAKGKEDIHYADFEPVVEWLERFDMPTTLFQQDRSSEALVEQKLVEEAKGLVDSLVENMLALEPS